MQETSNWKTFYHETSLVAANSIISKQIFHPSKISEKHNPLFGPGIYFATTINGAHYKSNHHGYILAADVLINKPKEMTKVDAQNIKNNSEFWEKIRNEGYDSIYGKGMPTGDEVIVFDQSHIKNIKLVKCIDKFSHPTSNWNLENILNTRNRRITLFCVSSNLKEAEKIAQTQRIPQQNGIFGLGIYLYDTIDDALVENPNCKVFISVYADLSNLCKLEPNEKINDNEHKCFYSEVNSIKYFYFRDPSLLSSIHVCGNFESIKDMTCEVFVADLPMNRKEKNETVSQVEDFLNKLFVGYGVLRTPDAITIRTKKDHYGIPSSAYAFVKFENYDEATKAVNELNYTKFHGISIRLILGDEETKKIIDSKIGNVFVKNLDLNLDVSELHKAFSKYGDIISCEIPSDIINVGDEKKNIPRGYGYIQFRHFKDAQKAINDSNKICINEKPIKVELFNNHSYLDPEDTFTNCYISNLPEGSTDRDIFNIFSSYGTPVSCKVMSKPKYGKVRTFGYCSMSNHNEAQLAVKGLNGSKIKGKIVKCSRAMAKNERVAKSKINHYKYNNKNRNFKPKKFVH